MVEAVQEKAFKSADEFIKFLLFEQNTDNLAGANSLQYVFRGERTTGEKYKLLPSSLRKYNKVLCPPDIIEPVDSWLTELSHYGSIRWEFENLYQFYNTANKKGIRLPDTPIFEDFQLLFNKRRFFNNEITWIPDELFEIAGVAQHYGVPTRLLDWSFNPFTALYFAAIGAVDNFYKDILKRKEDGEITTNIRRYDQNDSIVVWALNVRNTEAINEELDNTKLKIIKPPYSRNPNLAAQQGIFTHEQNTFSGKKSDYPVINRIPLDQKLQPIRLSSPVLIKYLIPINESNRVLRHLETLNHTSSDIFPGFNGVAREVNDKKKRLFLCDIWSF